VTVDMTAKELIEILKKLNPSTMILVEGYEGGLSDIIEAKTLKVERDINSEHYYGRHEEAKVGDVEAWFLPANIEASEI